MHKYLIIIALSIFIILVVSYFFIGSDALNGVVQSSADYLPPVWMSGVEEQFLADVYSSVDSAAGALGRQISADFSEVVDDKKAPSMIHIYTDNGADKVNASALYALSEQLRKENETTEVFIHSNVMQEPIERVDGNTVIVKLEQAQIKRSSVEVAKNVQVDCRSGTLIAQVSGFAGRFNKAVDFAEKSWLENFSDLLNNNKDVNLFIARSKESCKSQAQAYQQAVDDTCQKITSMFKGLANRSLLLHDDFRITASDILNNSLIIDKFTQSLQTYAGPVYRQALLVDISPEKINQLKLHKKMQIGSMKASLLRRFSSVAGLVILIAILYLFLNAATRGYYSLALKVAALVFMIAGAFLIYLFLT